MKFEPSEDEKRIMENERQRKPKDLKEKEILFRSFGIVFRSHSCNRISEYGMENFIKKANNLLESKEVVAYKTKLRREESVIEEKVDMYNKRIKEIELHIELLRKERDTLMEESDNLQFIDDAEWKKVIEKEKQLLISIGITPIDYCHGESFTRFLLLSLVESETPKPKRRYSDLNKKEKREYIEKLEKRIAKLERKHTL